MTELGPLLSTASSDAGGGCAGGAAADAPSLSAADSAGEPAATGLSAPVAVLTSSGEFEPANSAIETRTFIKIILAESLKNHMYQREFKL